MKVGKKTRQTEWCEWGCAEQKIPGVKKYQSVWGNSCQRVCGISQRGQQAYDRIQMEMRLVAQVGYDSSEELEQKRGYSVHN